MFVFLTEALYAHARSCASVSQDMGKVFRFYDSIVAYHEDVFDHVHGSLILPGQW